MLFVAKYLQFRANIEYTTIYINCALFYFFYIFLFCKYLLAYLNRVGNTHKFKTYGAFTRNEANWAELNVRFSANNPFTWFITTILMADGGGTNWLIDSWTAVFACNVIIGYQAFSSVFFTYKILKKGFFFRANSGILLMGIAIKWPFLITKKV